LRAKNGLDNGVHLTQPIKAASGESLLSTIYRAFPSPHQYRRTGIIHDYYYYAELMLESGLFIFDFEEMADDSKWRLKMKVYEHRWRGR